MLNMMVLSGRSDMGCHIDGFIAVVAHTHVLQDGAVTGRAADVIAAANTAAEVALRLVRPGKKGNTYVHFIYCTS
jgi:methionine aminopeptidase